MQEQLHRQPEVTQTDIERTVIVEAVCETEAGMSLLKWLAYLCCWERPIMNMEDAVRRDVWINIRRYVPIEKLRLIEQEGIRHQQAVMREIQQELINATQIVGEPNE